MVVVVGGGVGAGVGKDVGFGFGFDTGFGFVVCDECDVAAGVAAMLVTTDFGTTYTGRGACAICTFERLTDGLCCAGRGG